MFLYRFVHVCMCLSVHICMCVVYVHVRTYIPRCVLAAVVLAGTSGSGKSVCVDTVVSAVNSLKHHSGETAPIHVKLHRLYPMVFEDLSALYGQATPEGDWKDGVFSALLRKALQVHTYSETPHCAKVVGVEKEGSCGHDLVKKKIDCP